jgi:hypothetical protein
MSEFSASTRRMTDEETAAYLGKTKRTLARWRQLGAGPVYVRVGIRPEYFQRDVDAGWKVGGFPTRPRSASQAEPKKKADYEFITTPTSVDWRNVGRPRQQRNQTERSPPATRHGGASARTALRRIS